MKHEDDLFDENGIMRDGGTLHVPFRFMDHMGKQTRLMVHDGQGDACHRPGPRYSNTPAVISQVAANDAARVTREAMLGDSLQSGLSRESYLDRIQNAWRAA